MWIENFYLEKRPAITRNEISELRLQCMLFGDRRTHLAMLEVLAVSTSKHTPRMIVANLSRI